MRQASNHEKDVVLLASAVGLRLLCRFGQTKLSAWLLACLLVVIRPATTWCLGGWVKIYRQIKSMYGTSKFA